MFALARIQYRWPFALAAAAFVSCFVMAGWMRTLPMMVRGRRPSVGEALAMVSVPALAAAGAMWATYRGRRVALAVISGILGVFTVVTGFSIGTAFVPAFVLLVWANIASIDSAPPAES